MDRVAPRDQPEGLPALSQVGLLAGPLLSMLDASVVNVALPAIGADLRSPLATTQWVASGYLLAAAAGLAATAYLAKRYGNRPVYLVCLLGFTAASALCALAGTIGVLIATRVAQGLCGAPLVPIAMNLLLGGGTARRMPPAAGIVLFLAPAVGPTVGGLLIDSAGWPAIFLINVPIGLAGALGVLRLRLPASELRPAAVPFDPIGLVLLAAGLALAIYGVSQGPQLGWLAGAVWPAWAGGAALLGLYVGWALRRPDPAVDLALLREAQTALQLALSALAAVVMFAVLILVPVFLETVQGLSPLLAGLALLPQGIVTGLGTVLGARLVARYGLRASAGLGLLLLLACTAALLLVGAATPGWVVALILSGRGLAIGLTIQPLLEVMLGGVAPRAIADANTLFNVTQRLAGSLGISLLVTFFQIREWARVGEALRELGIPQSPGGLDPGAMAQLPPAGQARLAEAAVGGFHDALALLVAVSALGVIAAVFLRERKAASREHGVTARE